MKCPRCGASGSQDCVTTSGRPTRRHVDRKERELRRLEAAITTAAEHAEWITASDAAKVDAALILARRIDDTIHTLIDAGQIVDDAAPLARSKGSTLTYELSELSRQLDGLGLSPRGRRELGLVVDDDDDDELGAILNLAR